MPGALQLMVQIKSDCIQAPGYDVAISVGLWVRDLQMQTASAGACEAIMLTQHVSQHLAP